MENIENEPIKSSEAEADVPRCFVCKMQFPEIMRGPSTQGCGCSSFSNGRGEIVSAYGSRLDGCVFTGPLADASVAEQNICDACLRASVISGSLSITDEDRHVLRGSAHGESVVRQNWLAIFTR